MKRREFLIGGGSLFLAGCAGGAQRQWADVPWVAQGVPPPPTSRASAPAPAPPMCPPRAVVAPACPPQRPVSVPACPPRAPATGGAGWTMVARAAWGAQPLRANHDPLGAVSRITLHHTDEHAGMRGRPDAEVVRAIQRYHQDQLGWADIGYHYLVGTDGRVYEGRALAAQGAHSGGANNRNNLGISVIGNFSTQLPAPRQLAALAGFLEDRRRAFGVAPQGLLGHRDLGATECPGDALYAWLQDVKRG
jgi:N-acetylmuramoyl-L-alanine amidase